MVYKDNFKNVVIIACNTLASIQTCFFICNAEYIIKVKHEWN